MKAQTHPVRQDVMRGVRWGTILVLALLLSVAGYRMVSSTPAVASQAVPEPVLATPAEPVPTIEVKPGAEALSVQKSPNEEVPSPPGESPRLRATPRPDRSSPPEPIVNPFVPAPGPAPAPVAKSPLKPVVVDGSLPEAVEVGRVADVPVSGSGSQLAPPPDGKPGRTGKIVRSVGRIFRIGRKESEDKQQ